MWLCFCKQLLLFSFCYGIFLFLCDRSVPSKTTQSVSYTNSSKHWKKTSDIYPVSPAKSHSSSQTSRSWGIYVIVCSLVHPFLFPLLLILRLLLLLHCYATTVMIVYIVSSGCDSSECVSFPTLDFPAANCCSRTCRSCSFFSLQWWEESCSKRYFYFSKLEFSIDPL